MNRSVVYKTPQFMLSLVGGWLVLTGTISLLADSPPTIPTPSSGKSSTSLRVVPSGQLPASSIDHLQGARGLQNQTGGNLQRSNAADQLQPNAKTDNFTATEEVQ